MLTKPQLSIAALALCLGANPGLPASANQIAIQKAYKDWKTSQLRAGNYVADSQCNLQGVRELMQSGRRIGSGFGTAGFSYGDINKDGKEDALITFNPQQCDGGNALMNAQTTVLILSANNGSRYIVDDKKLENLKGLPDGMWARFEKFTRSGNITGTAFGYRNSDPRCCPSLKADFTYTYPSSRINLN